MKIKEKIYMLKNLFENKMISGTAENKADEPVNTLSLAEYLMEESAIHNRKVEQLTRQLFEANANFDFKAIPELHRQLKEAVAEGLTSAHVRNQFPRIAQARSDEEQKRREQVAADEQVKGQLIKQIADHRVKRALGQAWSGSPIEDAQTTAKVTAQTNSELMPISLGQVKLIARKELHAVETAEFVANFKGEKY